MLNDVLDNECCAPSHQKKRIKVERRKRGVRIENAANTATRVDLKLCRRIKALLFFFSNQRDENSIVLGADMSKMIYFWELGMVFHSHLKYSKNW